MQQLAAVSIVAEEMERRAIGEVGDLRDGSLLVDDDEIVGRLG